jgi:hypothetical protein
VGDENRPDTQAERNWPVRLHLVLRILPPKPPVFARVCDTAAG